jgi:hypothetical protein
MRKYFFTDGKNKFGPFSKEELKTQKINHSTKVWYYGLDKWVELSEIRDLDDLFKTNPPESNPRNVPIENNIQTTEEKAVVKKIPIYPKRKKSKLIRWGIGIGALATICLITIILVQKQSEANLYEEIVANSYDGDVDFNIYVEKFYRDLEFHRIRRPKTPQTTIIKFSRLDQIDNATHIHALSCGYEDDSRIEIYINPYSWDKFTKPMRYLLMYHELAHDVLNVDDLDATPINEGKLMYPESYSYEKKIKDDIIESFHAMFEENSQTMTKTARFK